MSIRLSEYRFDDRHRFDDGIACSTVDFWLRCTPGEGDIILKMKFWISNYIWIQINCANQIFKNAFKRQRIFCRNRLILNK